MNEFTKSLGFLVSNFRIPRKYGFTDTLESAVSNLYLMTYLTEIVQSDYFFVIEMNHDGNKGFNEKEIKQIGPDDDYDRSIKFMQGIRKWGIAYGFACEYFAPWDLVFETKEEAESFVNSFESDQKSKMDQEKILADLLSSQRTQMPYSPKEEEPYKLIAKSDVSPKKIITVGQIAKCYRLYIEIFEEEDQDYPDGRIVNNKENAELKLLRKMVGDNEEMVKKARDIVDHIRVPGGDDGDDGSYKPLCDDFRKLGFVVVDDDSKGNFKPSDLAKAAKGGDKDGKK